MERDCESELSKLNIEQNACIYHFGASVIHGQRSNILRLPTMKLLYLWIENYKDIIKNQSFNISSAYNISYDEKTNTLYISKNGNYIENFYGKNMLDITAIVGNNGAGKTTLTRLLYDYCDSVHPCDVDEEYENEESKQIIIYEKENLENNEPRKLVIYYYLSDKPMIVKDEDIPVMTINLNSIKTEEFLQAEKEHDVSIVYFTNAFEISNVMNNQGFSEFSSYGVHKSLCYSPMLSMQRSLNRLKNHYGAESIENGMILDVINQYAQKMTGNFKISYATAMGYNFLIATRYFPGAIVSFLPVMKDFKLNITEFGEYVRNPKGFLKQSPFDQTVIFIRKNIYEHLIDRFKKNHWEQIYLNVLCEIVLFLNIFNSGYINVDFEILERENIKIDSNEALEILLDQIKDDEKKKQLIRRIRNVQGVDLDIICDFIKLQDGNMQVLKESKWYKQVQNFLSEYENIKSIEIDGTIDYGYTQLIELILENYGNRDTVYGRMLNIVPQPMSSGEVAMINIFATVYSALKKNTSGSILLILDEIDAFLHPKWQQDILTHITRWINESEQFENKKVQLIVATHSPIILSDIPKDNIIYLKKPFEVVSGSQLTFGANIGALFYDSFFMKQGSIGCIAKREIQWVIDNIENPDLSMKEKQKMVYIINNIGDKFLRERLKSYPVYIEMVAENGETYDKNRNGEGN